MCILGGEIAYTICLFYGSMLQGKAAELHHALFQLLPGFTWISFGSWIIGAISIALWSGIAGGYIAWMHNASIQK